MGDSGENTVDEFSGQDRCKKRSQKPKPPYGG